MNPPTGTCYPPSVGMPRFSRSISFVYAFFLKREGQQKITNGCDDSKSTGWTPVSNFPPIEGGRDTFSFTLEFEFDFNFQIGGDPRTMYKCTNINNYTQEFEAFMLALQAKANRAASDDSANGQTSESTCQTSDCETGKIIINRRRLTTVAGIQLMQSNTPGCA
jgi:hypothetical protein